MCVDAMHSANRRIHIQYFHEPYRVWVKKFCTPNFISSKTEKFYTRIWRLNLRQITKFHAIILKFDKIMPYYARLRRVFHFHNAFTTKHKLLIFDNKQTVKNHKLLRYYS